MEVQVVGPNALAGSPKLNRSGQANGSIAFMLLVMICLHDLSAAGATSKQQARAKPVSRTGLSRWFSFGPVLPAVHLGHASYDASAVLCISLVSHGSSAQLIATALSFSMCCLTHALDHLRPTLGVVLSCGSELRNCETNDRTVTSDLLNQRQRRVHGHSVWLGIGEVRKL